MREQGLYKYFNIQSVVHELLLAPLSHADIVRTLLKQHVLPFGAPFHLVEAG